MPIPLRPQLRPLEVVPLGRKEECLVALRDPEGFGQTLPLPGAAALLAVLMDGRRTLSEVQEEFRAQTGMVVALSDVEDLVRHLDDAHLLAGERFERYRREQIAAYLGNPVRPASHAGAVYAAEPEALREQLAGFFTAEGGPGVTGLPAPPEGGALCGLLSPHIDLDRGGPVYAWAYQTLAQRSDADLLVIFGTAHSPMHELFCLSRKDFDTPLGVVPTDRQFIDRLAEHLASSVAGRQIDLFADELVHRGEHSIEFPAVLLQYLLGGKRDFRIVPVLVGSFHEFLTAGTPPDESPQLQAMAAAVRAAAAAHTGRVCYIAAADFAHIGQRFGDEWLIDQDRRCRQSASDQQLLQALCRCDSAAFFRHVAAQENRSRVCGFSPAYTLLTVMEPARGELLKYAQAVEPDLSACVSFASIAFYRREPGSDRA
jgi:hypothetical protein